MKKFTILSVLLLSMTLAASAQNRGNLSIKGSLYDFGSAEPLYPANVSVLSLPDSTFVNGAASAEDGSFTVTGLSAGNYVVRCEFIGYVTTEKSFTLRSGNRTMDLGRITLKEDAQVLKEVAVTAALSKVQMVNDTVVFNSEAFKMPEGSSLEELVRRLPGVQITSDGDIKVNGKSVSRILVNGKEFFNNDKSVAMQNLTTDMIEKLKVYDKQSDNARMTGIDDGEEETVIDLQVKKGMAQGWFGNLTVGYGRPTKKTEFNVNNLYTVSLNVNRFAEDRQMTVLGSYGNTRAGGVGGFGGMRGMGSFGGGGGVSTNGQVGINFARNIGEEVYSDSYKFEIGGSLNYSHSSSDSRSKSNSENFNQGFTTFSDRINASVNNNDNINGQLRFEWNANQYTSLVFTPQLSFSKSNGHSENQSVSFAELNPHKLTDNPLIIIDYLSDTTKIKDSVDPAAEILDSLYDAVRNSQNSLNKSKSQTFSTSGNMQFVHRFNTAGRNISFRGNYSYSNGSSESFSRNDQYMMGAGNKLENNPQLRYSETPNPSYNVSGSLSYTEPIANRTYLQASYQISYRHSNSDRSTYDINDNRWGLNDFWYLDSIAQADRIKNDRQSTKSYYENLDHTIQLQFRKQSDNYNFTVGFSFLPQHSAMIYSGMGVVDSLLERTVYNYTPTINFRYRWTRQEQINLSYNGRSSQPSMENLLDITDDSNPLSVRKGNPNLEPTFSNTFRVNYSKYNPTNLFSISANASFGNTLRNISNLSAVDQKNRMTITQPLNMSGFFSNWNASAGLNLNIALPDQRFTFSSNTQGSFRNQEGWSATFNTSNMSDEEYEAFRVNKILNSNVPISDYADISTTTTKSIGASERLEFSYRDDWVDITLMGNVNYDHSTNSLYPDRNMDTWSFQYGPTGTFLFPWHNLRLITDLSMSSRRGYGSDDMNTDELIWNAQVQISFLKGNRATLSAAVYDILHQRSDVSRSMTATSRSDSYNNNINSYFLVTFNYRLQMFGDRETRQNMRSRGNFGGGGMGGFGGGGMGGFGGGG
ncbi:MAG: outer membrane beta-barrel protein, partial [Bacteroidaceae bacterium]|nr:outer membrane beta-barrel protein [Bacteroidaceae bacterium]